MKIAFLSTFYPFRGGIAQFNAALYRELEKIHEVKAFNFTVQYPKILFPGKTQFVTEEDSADKIESQRILNSVQPISYFKTVKAIKKWEPDVLIIGYWTSYMAPSLGFVAKKCASFCQVVSIVHNAFPHESGVFDHVLTKYFFKRHAFCITLSEAVKTSILENFPTMKVKVLPHPEYNHFGNAVSREEAMEKLSLDKSKKYLLFFGLIRDYKGLDQLLVAMEKLDDSIHLLIAGEPYEDFGKYQKIIDSKNLKSRIHLYLDYISDKEIKYYFSAVDAVVLPYKSGTQSGIIAIAQNFQKPIVATNVGGLSEFIQSPQEGIIVPPNDLEELKRGIEKVLQMEVSPPKKEDKFTWSDFAEKLTEYFGE